MVGVRVALANNNHIYLDDQACNYEFPLYWHQTLKTLKFLPFLLRKIYITPY